MRPFPREFPRHGASQSLRGRCHQSDFSLQAEIHDTPPKHRVSVLVGKQMMEGNPCGQRREPSRNDSAMSLRAVFWGEAISRLSGQLDCLGIASLQRTLLAMTNTTVLM
jgi:hypothetical protein